MKIITRATPTVHMVPDGVVIALNDGMKIEVGHHAYDIQQRHFRTSILPEETTIDILNTEGKRFNHFLRWAKLPTNVTLEEVTYEELRERMPYKETIDHIVLTYTWTEINIQEF